MSREPLNFGEVNTMNCEQFDQWWDGKDPDSTANPYRKDTPAFWAWAGWKAGVKAEREACAKLCETRRELLALKEQPYLYIAEMAELKACAASIRARSNQ